MSLEPCPACARHLKPTETRCPFCAADLARSRRRAWTLAAAVTATALAVGVACKDDPVAVPPYGIPPIEDAGPADAGPSDAGS